MNSALRYTRPLGKRGQVVIPKDIRLHLGLAEGGPVVFEVHEGRVGLRGPDAATALAEFLSLPKHGRGPSPARLKAMLAEGRRDVR